MSPSITKVDGPHSAETTAGRQAFHVTLKGPLPTYLPVAHHRRLLRLIMTKGDHENVHFWDRTAPVARAPNVSQHVAPMALR